MKLAEKLNISPEYMELWARRLKIKGGQRLLVLSGLLPQGCLDDHAAGSRLHTGTHYSCLGFPTDNILDGKELWAQPRIRLAWLAEGGRVILLWGF